MTDPSPFSRPPRSKRAQILGLLASMVITFVAAGLAGMASVEAGSFYLELAKPAWAPPAWLFGPVWTMLYALMAVAAWLVWRKRGWHAARGVLILYGVQLAVNALWSWLFFAWHEGTWAFLDIILLWILIVATLITSARHSRWATALFLPYFAWVSFAGFLCFTIWQMNPDLL